MGVSDEGRRWMGVADEGRRWTGYRRNSIAFFPPSPDLKNSDGRKISSGLGVAATASAEDGEEAAGMVDAKEGWEAHDHAGPAVSLSYAVSGLSALLSVFCYAEFVAGGSFSYLCIELNDFLTFVAAGNILLEAVVGAAELGWWMFCDFNFVI
ncbi:hypothetical protein RHGRI_011877 [Rhododendron griersonianum]|uniref:NADH dehydrogenase subunit 6 n=1 Tax=Rhododendron griersonianum TaxID=479676 RepID=A0AAV6KNZ0_9ERIC|nr:hypothetical protein RHGRI_011877 [Rhododendron griersonianum]